MTESQRQPVPREDGGELDTALAFLRFARESLVKKTAGLDEEQVRRVLVPTGTNLLGLVQHMTDGERYWFGHHVAGHEQDAAPDFGMAVPADRSTAEVLADYRAACADSDAIIRAVGRPGSRIARPVDDEPKTLRWVLAHVITETTRHAGHADILRELIDGVTGR
ncbi:MAG: DinB family protein [Mycobacteriales bacterium]